ncbi:MAG: phage tail sheath family protein [Ilumatobacter sp.]
MPTYLTPGVYVEEVPSGSMPLAAAATAVAAFVGFTERAPLDKPDTDPNGESPRMVTSWAEYKKLYGGFTNDALLPQAVFGFFNNGGGRCYIVRIPDRSLKKAALTVEGAGALEGVLKASSNGESPTLEFRSLAASGDVTVELNPQPTADEVAAVEAESAIAEARMPEWKKTIRDRAAPIAGEAAKDAVGAASKRGVERRVEVARSAATNLDEDADAAGEQARSAAEAAAAAVASGPAEDAAMSAAIKAAEKAVNRAKGEAASDDDAQADAESSAIDAAFDPDPETGVATDAAGKAALAAAATALADGPSFALKITHGDTIEMYPSLTVGDLARTLNDESDLVQVINHAQDGSWLAVGDDGLTLTLAQSSKLPVAKADFDGDFEERKGVTGLAIAEDVTMVMIPDLITAASKGKAPGKYDEKLWMGVQQTLVTHCEGERNRMAILDPPPGLNPQEVRQWLSLANLNSKFAALYYPWLEVDNPVGSKADGNTTVFVPPSGHMAGIWSRTDETRGVWKAPANEPVRGILGLQQDITRLEQELLNPVGINAIRPFGTQGIKVWGARTLSATDPSWKYINVRRLFNMVEATIMDGTQWVVFEPNDQALWERVKRTVNAFLLGLWRDGALFGASPDAAFFVKCDAENNPPESRDEGKLIVEVGIAPVLPAEFVIFRISQKAQTS